MRTASAARGNQALGSRCKITFRVEDVLDSNRHTEEWRLPFMHGYRIKSLCLPYDEILIDISPCVYLRPFGYASEQGAGQSFDG